MLKRINKGLLFFCVHSECFSVYLVNLFQGVPNVDFKFFVGYGKVKVPKVILKNYTNFVVTDGTGSGWPLDKMEIKKWKQISTSTFAV